MRISVSEFNGTGFYVVVSFSFYLFVTKECSLIMSQVCTVAATCITLNLIFEKGEASLSDTEIYLL